MRLMWNTGAKHSRIINISDIREGNSRKFYSLINKDSDLHSIFSIKRAKELTNVLKNLDSDTFIFKAWGVGGNSQFQDLIDRCLKKLPKDVKIIGLEKNKDESLCYHPYSTDPKKLIKWFNDAMELIYSEVSYEWFLMLNRKYGSL